MTLSLIASEGWPRAGAGPCRTVGVRHSDQQLPLQHRRKAGPPAGLTPHRLLTPTPTESLRLGAALQDVQDALGHADPRTTRRYDRSRHNLDRSPNYLLAAALTVATDNDSDEAP